MQLGRQLGLEPDSSEGLQDVHQNKGQWFEQRVRQGSPDLTFMDKPDQNLPILESLQNSAIAMAMSIYRTLCVLVWSSLPIGLRFDSDFTQISEPKNDGKSRCSAIALAMSIL